MKESVRSFTLAEPGNEPSGRDIAVRYLRLLAGGGVLCEPNDSKSLADALEELFLNPDRARALGEAGRRAVAEKFSAEAMARATLQVFESVVKRG